MNPYHLMIGVVMSLIIGGMALNAYLVEPIEVIKEVPMIEEVAPDWATDEDAVKAAQDVLRRKQLQADLDTKLGQKAALEAEIDALEDELQAL